MFNATLAVTVLMGLVASLVLNILVVKYLARKSEKAIEAEVMKANKRLTDQINSRVG